MKIPLTILDYTPLNIYIRQELRQENICILLIIIAALFYLIRTEFVVQLLIDYLM